MGWHINHIDTGTRIDGAAASGITGRRELTTVSLRIGTRLIAAQRVVARLVVIRFIVRLLI